MTLDALFQPESVAVIGASTHAGKIGRAIMRNFIEDGFHGRAYAVNPNAEEVMGRKSYDSVLDIDDDIDLAVVSIPPKFSNGAIQDCVEKDVDCVIVITSGYKEIGEDGKKRSEELAEILDGSDTRILGPNCIGIFDTHSGVDTLFVPTYKLERPEQGNIAIVTQSGALGATVLDMLAEMEVGISRFVSYGNQEDITEVELLDWLKEDDKTDAIAIYTEGLSDGREFLKKAREVTEEMPVIALKAGKFESGKSAVVSHTGSLAGSYEIYQGAFKQTGVLEAESLEELFDHSRALAYNEPMEGEKVAVITNGGGLGVLSADALEKRGLELAEFSKSTKKKLREIIPSYGNVENPLDLLGDANSRRYKEALDILKDEDNIDGFIIIPLLQLLPLESDVIDTIINFKESTDRPVVVSTAGGEYTKIHMKNLEEKEVAAYHEPEKAASSLESLYNYGKWKERSGKN